MVPAAAINLAKLKLFKHYYVMVRHLFTCGLWAWSLLVIALGPLMLPSAHLPALLPDFEMKGENQNERKEQRRAVG